LHGREHNERELVGKVSGDMNCVDIRKNNISAPKYDLQKTTTQLSKLPIKSHCTVRNAAISMKMPWSTLFKYTKKYGATVDNEQQIKQLKNITKKTTNQLKQRKKHHQNTPQCNLTKNH
jgi:hypothetical protein